MFLFVFFSGSSGLSEPEALRAGGKPEDDKKGIGWILISRLLLRPLFCIENGPIS